MLFVEFLSSVILWHPVLTFPPALVTLSHPRLFLCLSLSQDWTPWDNWTWSVSASSGPRAEQALNKGCMSEWVNGSLYHLVAFYACLAPNLHGQFSCLMTWHAFVLSQVLPKDWDSGLTSPGAGSACFQNAALFWWNLHRSGEGDGDTLHAGCPVLVGDKWGKACLSGHGNWVRGSG